MVNTPASLSSFVNTWNFYIDIYTKNTPSVSLRKELEMTAKFMDLPMGSRWGKNLHR